MALPSADELSGDASVPLYMKVTWTQYLLLFVSILTLMYLALLKACFNTYSTPRAIREEKQRVALEDAYHALFARREEMLYHINWTKSRGESKAETDELRRFAEKLKEIDELITTMENKIVETYNEQGVAPRSWVKKDD